MKIDRIELPAPGIELLQTDARSEGYQFIERLVTEWASGENRFDAPGEILCGHIAQEGLVAVGGLNRDPFAGRPEIGRIRRIYVRPAWRNQGLASALVTTLIDHARQSFRCVRLRAENPNAARLYERLGFSAQADEPNATHILRFDE